MAVKIGVRHDEVIMKQGEHADIFVLRNDDSPVDSKTITITAMPQHGTIDPLQGTDKVVYRPRATFVGKYSHQLVYISGST